MAMMGSPGTSSEMSSAIALLKLSSDPKATEQRLNKLSEAKSSVDNALKELSAREANLKFDLSTLEKDRKTLAVAAEKHNLLSEEFVAAQKSSEDAFLKREQSLSKKESSLANDRKSLATERQSLNALSAEIADRESELAKKEAELNVRAIAVKSQEEALAKMGEKFEKRDVTLKAALKAALRE
jgi:uncharacterized protein (DUF3084 family)